ncbi:MAG TPA: ABC transporter substrate-binding protein [Gammaproteobacteria bacterium]|nr:ABC transporter substrate-binding protein [Gammaproteobacteria bacterium]
MNARFVGAVMIMAGAILAGSLPVARAAESPVAGQIQTQATAQAGPVQVVERLHQGLIEAMKKGKKLGFDGRYKLLEPIVTGTYDIPYVARLTLGSHWGALDEAQRKRFIGLLGRYTTTNYAAEFDRYDGQQFQTESQQSLQQGVESVKTRFTSGDGSKHHQFTYLLHRQEGAWRIINVVVDGVSDLSLKRSEYSQVMQSGGFQALAARLKASIDKLAHRNE